jgi:hypothetical protein
MDGGCRDWRDQPDFDRQKIAGLEGLSHARFGGPDENNPCSEHGLLQPKLFLNPDAQHCRPFAEKRNVFREWPEKAAQSRFPTVFRERMRRVMKLSRVSKGLVRGLALLLATSAFASNTGSLNVQEAITVSGKQLPAGDYKVKWDGTGSNVEVSIVKGKTVLATAPARLVDLKESPRSDAAIVRKNDDGSRSLSEIRFSGKKFALAIGTEQAKADGGDTGK